jgi:cytochrome c553
MVRFIVVLSLLVLPFSAVGAGDDNTAKMAGSIGDASKGEPIAKQLCSVCHGPDGNSPLAMNPNLATQHSEYLYKQLQDFKSGARNNAIMTGMTVSLSEDDLRNLAAYYESQPASTTMAKNMALVAQGQDLYRGGIPEKGISACSACHSPDGSGIPPQYPRVSGQHAEYTATQLRAFRSGERDNDGNHMMRMIASRLSESEIMALAEYISGLH